MEACVRRRRNLHLKSPLYHSNAITKISTADLCVGGVSCNAVNDEQSAGFEGLLGLKGLQTLSLKSYLHPILHSQESKSRKVFEVFSNFKLLGLKELHIAFWIQNGSEAYEPFVRKGRLERALRAKLLGLLEAVQDAKVEKEISILGSKS